MVHGGPDTSVGDGSHRPLVHGAVLRPVAGLPDVNLGWEVVHRLGQGPDVSGKVPPHGGAHPEGVLPPGLDSEPLPLVEAQQHGAVSFKFHLNTTVLTDLYDQTKDIKLAQAAAGHTTSAMTLRYYVKGRETIRKAAAVVDRAYSA